MRIQGILKTVENGTLKMLYNACAVCWCTAENEKN